MSVIWKYKVAAGEALVEMPEGSRILSFAWDDKEKSLCIWVLVLRVANPLLRTKVVVVGTGWEFDNVWMRFIGTSVLPNGYVFHCFVDMQ